MLLARVSIFLLLLAAMSTPVSIEAAKGHRREKQEKVKATAVLWKRPEHISSRDLFKGPIPADGAPMGPCVFVKEDLAGTNPKIDIRDAAGVKWKVKLGIEARPEVAASRLVWAVGYFTYEYIFVPQLHVEKMPEHLHRGRRLVEPDGSMKNVRFKKAPDGEEKIATWQWRDNPFIGSRELNGLRVLMAVMNNWDLKDVNNAVLRGENSESGAAVKDTYVISDLGSSFGTNNWVRPLTKAKGNLESYRESKFIRKVTPDHVDFYIGLRPSLINAGDFPRYVKYLKMNWLGKNIPRADAKWMGDLLGQLSPGQIQDAFRAAGYSPEEARGFSAVVLHRIDELKKL